jgi:hypothetical protein
MIFPESSVQAGKHAVDGLPRPDGREPSGRGAVAGSARPYPQAARSRRNAHPMTATAPLWAGRKGPGRRSGPKRAQRTSQC